MLTGNPKQIPLVVDLDGTLTHTDTLHESLVKLCRTEPLKALAVPLWLLRGKAGFKARLAEAVRLDPASLPYNSVVLSWIADAKSENRRVVLCTGANVSIAEGVATHLNIFDDVIASDAERNVSGKGKRVSLEERYGAKGYDYAGNSRTDIEVWKGARRAILVNTTASVQRSAGEAAEIERVFAEEKASLAIWPKLLRLHQWVKNLLIFVPAIAAHQFSDFETWTTLALAFFAFSICASGVYVTNDLLDVESDRKHPRKRHRPFAAGTIPLKVGAAAAPLLLALGLLLSYFVGPQFFGCLALYVLITAAYSLKLKKYAMVDCMTLAGLYTLRVIAGAAAVAVPLSFWMLAFSTFIFLSLAFLKRYTEITVKASEGEESLHGRGFKTSDSPFVLGLGVTSGYVSVLVLALYVNSETVTRLYSQPQIVWLAVLLVLFWISWVWLKAFRNEMHDDPIVFSLKDGTSLAVGILMIATFAAATLLGR